MSYSGAATAKAARENLGRSLASLQEDPNIPQDVLAVAQNLAQGRAGYAIGISEFGFIKIDAGLQSLGQDPTAQVLDALRLLAAGIGVHGSLLPDFSLSSR